MLVVPFAGRRLLGVVVDLAEHMLGWVSVLILHEGARYVHRPCDTDATLSIGFRAA